MEKYAFHNLNTINFTEWPHVVIYGAGLAGRAIEWYLINKYDVNVENIAFCDRDEGKHNHKIAPPIYSISKAASLGDAVYLVGFYNNDNTKISSAIDALMNLSVERENIYVIDMESRDFKEIGDESLINFYEQYEKIKKEKEEIKKVKKIRFLSGGFKKENELAGGGGPIGVICMQKSLLGTKYKDIDLEYPYYEDNQEYRNRFNKYYYMSGATLAVMNMVSDDKDTIYVANDVFSAYGLYLSGKNYVVIFHAQGDVVNEITQWGNQISDRVKELVYRIEKITMENAVEFLFPSYGAEVYFRKSFVDVIFFAGGEPVYNTITDFSEPEPIADLYRIDDRLTFLSIGQMTELKGMDRIPKFLEDYAAKTSQKIRWIVVADGVLKEKVAQDMSKIIENGADIEFVNIDHKIPHAQIYYLLSIADVYLMLHRVSIFDFSTLEAMAMGKPIILSDIPGNTEFNIRDNVLLVGENTDSLDIEIYIRNRDTVGKRNKEVYNNVFGYEAFKTRYNRFLDRIINKVERK